MKHSRWLGLAVAASLGACSVTPTDTSPTLKSLEKRSVPVDTKAAPAPSPEKAIKSYESLLQNTTDEELRQRAMRRLADLQMRDRDTGPVTDRKQEAAPAVQTAEVEKAIKLYETLLRTNPNAKDNDRILYQLARAYEQTTELEKSLETLTKLVQSYPKSQYFDEAQFRRGETLFAFREFNEAEKAYRGALQLGKRSPFYERATYKHGWAVFKQDRYKDALPSFLALIDLKLANRKLGDDIETFEFLSKGDKELIRDALRVTSLCLTNLEGPKTLQSTFSQGAAPNYEFLLYRSLGDLYLKQERWLDAASTYSAFGVARPEHPQSILMQIEAIELYQQRGYADRVLDGKKELAARYSKYIEFWATNTHYGFDQYLMHGDPALEKKIEDYVVATLEELAKFYHNRAQKTKNALDYKEAIKWYQTFLRSFGQHPKAPELNFLLAEASFEDKRYSDAIREYEKTAYNYNRHKQSADAGYAALLAYEEYKKTLAGDEQAFWSKLEVQSSERFSKLFPKDSRTPGVLIKALNDLYEKKQYAQAEVFAQRVLQVVPESDTKARGQAMAILATTAFEGNRYQEAEKMYTDILQTMPASDKNRAGMVDRLAASIYKQGEALRAQNMLEDSTAMFLRVGTVAPTSAIRATADYDAAANLINLKQWNRAIPVLESFQTRFPNHQLKADVSAKLATAYLESGDNIRAADYLQKIVVNEKDKGVQQGTVWQSAELYEKAQSYDRAIVAYSRFIKEFSPPAEEALEARQRIVDLYGKLNQPNNQRVWQKEIVTTVNAADPKLPDRARLLASNAAMALAEPVYQDYHRIKLTAPLKDSIARKKKALDDAIKAFNAAAEYRIAEVTTQAAFRIGEIYAEFSKSLLESDRPKGLSQDALDEYELALQDQAFPFEEKAIELHEANTKRIDQGVYDQWVKKSYAALAELVPARYAKTEKMDAVVDEIN